MHGDDTFGAFPQDRRWSCGVAEFGVALVGEHRDPSLAPPRGCGAKIEEFSRRVAGRVHPDAQGTFGVGGVDRVEVVVGHRPHAGERGPHLIRRVADRRVQHRVLVRRPKLEVLRDGGNELFRADARCEFGCRVDGAAEPACDPSGCRRTEGRRTDRGRIATRSLWIGERGDYLGGWRIAGRTDRQVDSTAVQLVGQRLEFAEPLVGVRRRHETCGHADSLGSVVR